jgi:hypothetical protein
MASVRSFSTISSHGNKNMINFRMMKPTLICAKVELWWEVFFVPGVDSECELEHVRDMDLVVPGVDDLRFHRAVNVLVLNVLTDSYGFVARENICVCVCGEKRKRETGRCSHAGFIEREKSHGDQFY